MFSIYKIFVVLSLLAYVIHASERINYRIGGKDYRGRQDKTNGGWTCQRWDRQYPHKHTRTP